MVIQYYLFWPLVSGFIAESSLVCLSIALSTFPRSVCPTMPCTQRPTLPSHRSLSRGGHCLFWCWAAAQAQLPFSGPRARYGSVSRVPCSRLLSWDWKPNEFTGPSAILIQSWPLCHWGREDSSIAKSGVADRDGQRQGPPVSPAAPPQRFLVGKFLRG